MIRSLKLALTLSWLISLLVIGLHEIPTLEIALEIRLSILVITLFINLLYIIFTFLTPISKKHKPVTLLILSVFLCIYFLFQTSRDSDWKTQTIRYQNKEHKASINFQMKDIGSHGYLRRTVEVKHYLYFINYIRETSPDNLNSSWQEVNIHVNELGIKGG